jgi:class 3 adenylate cyclase/tetratricopeptide (TPR) repeat protein
MLAEAARGEYVDAMNCPACGHLNRADAKFCLTCGAAFARSCPACGKQLPAEARFCDECGRSLAAPAPPAPSPAPADADPRAYTPPHLAEKILQDRAKLAGERRTVTVLFADAVGSTALGERLDEEAVYDIMRRAVALMLEAVHRYEGTVTQFRGDGVMALFGAPIAHEDAARRAVAAALAMQRALTEYAGAVEERHGLRLQFRVGLNTGPVVVGTISDTLAMDYTAIGDTVNLAARMEQLAEPGAVYLSAHTESAVRDYVECEPLGALAIRGKAEPVTAFKALREKGIRTRLEAAAGRGLTPYIGREQELAVLRDYLARAKRGTGRVVFVSGEAGIGKSRLLLEFHRSLPPDEVAWLEGHCISFGSAIAYLPVIDIVKAAFGVAEADTDARIIARVDDGTAGWDAGARATVPYLKYLLTVDPGDAAVTTMDPLERRAGIFDALRALLQQASRRRPLVVVVEDLHWVDEKSEEALAALVDVIAAAPVLLVLTARPGYAHRLGERSYFNRLALDHLPPDDSAALAEAVLRATALPEPLRRLITGKAEGNPFYIEEVTKSLVESGVLRRQNGSYALARPADEVRVPDTIQEVILARIDRLADEAKRAMQLASVIGREFTVRLLQRISEVQAQLDDALGELKALELIYEKGYLPELAYMFKHALTHDVAYSTLLLERRKALHRLVAGAIEELYADRLAEQYETLAYHYSEGEDWPKALVYLEKAGDKAAAVYANADALDFYARALQVCERLGDSTLVTMVSLAQRRGFVGLTIGDLPSVIADFDGMLNAARRLDDQHLQGMALAHRGMAEYLAHDFERAEESLNLALALAGEQHDDVRLLASTWLASLAVIVFARHTESKTLLLTAEDLASKVDDPFSRAMAGSVRQMLDNWAGRFSEAQKGLDLWASAAEGLHTSRSLHRWAKGLVLGGAGEYEQAIAVIREMIADCERVGEVVFRARAVNTLGWLYGEIGNVEEALTWNSRGIEAARLVNAPDPEIENNARLNLGDNLMTLGRLSEAEEQFLIVERVVRNPRPPDRWALWRYAQHMLHSYGELWLARGDAETARRYADECLALAGQTESRKNIVKARRLRGQVFLARGDLDAAEHELLTALDLAHEVANPPQLWKTYAALGELRAAQGRGDDARDAYAEALAVIDGVAAGLSDAELRTTFLESALVQGIRQAAASL